VILRRQLLPSAAALAAALLFSGCGTADRTILGPQPPPAPRVLLDSGPAVSPAAVAIAGWIEWVSPDGHTAVVELASAADPPRGRIWWARDDKMVPTAILAIQLPRRGRRIGAVVTQGRVRVGAEVTAAEPALAPKFPPLQSGASN